MPFRPSPRPLARPPLLLVAAILILVIHTLQFWPWTEDDAYISFRYARHLDDGDGLVYNPGERVEGLLQPRLGAAVGPGAEGRRRSPGRGQGGRPPRRGAHPHLRLAAGRPAGRRPLVAADFPGAAPAGPVPLIPRHAVSGLETVPYAACLLLVVDGLGAIDPPRRTRIVTVAAALGLVLLRAEGWFFLLGLSVVRALWARGRFARWSWPVPAGAGPGTHRWLEPVPVLLAGAILLAARYLYFGDVVPATAHVKVTPDRQTIIDGLIYCRAFLAEGGGWFLGALFLAVPLVGRPGESAARRLAPTFLLGAVAGVLQLGLVLVAGGDWMHFYRFIVPVYPLLAAGGVAGLIRARARAVALAGPGRLGRSAIDLGLAVALAAVVGYGLLSEVRTRRLVMPYVESGRHLTDAYRRAGEWLAADTAPGARSRPAISAPWATSAGVPSSTCSA